MTANISLFQDNTVVQSRSRSKFGNSPLSSARTAQKILLSTVLLLLRAYLLQSLPSNDCCLQSYYLATAVVQLLISRSSPGNGSTCHNNYARRLPCRRFVVCYIWGCDSSGYGRFWDVTRRLVRQKFTDVSEENTASIFRIEEQSNVIVNEFSIQRVSSSNIGPVTGKFLYISLWLSFVWLNEYWEGTFKWAMAVYSRTGWRVVGHLTRQREVRPSCRRISASSVAPSGNYGTTASFQILSSSTLIYRPTMRVT
jgi:hypothetical protein